MTQTFACSSCGAPLDYHEEMSATIRCPYCNHSVIVPPQLRKPTASQTSIHFNTVMHHPNQVSLAASGKLKLILLITGIALVAGILLPLLFAIPAIATVFGVTNKIVMEMEENSPGYLITPEITPSPTPGFGMQVYRFGEQGMGAGQFEDARSITVDDKGRIYVAQYLGGRVQVFDAEKKFITQWLVDPKAPVPALAAGRDGVIYLVQRGRIQRYDGQSGMALGELETEFANGFEDVVVTLDGKLAASRIQAGDTIVLLNQAGETLLTIPKAISTQTGDSELGISLAVDGTGNIFALGRFSNAIFKFAPDGRFINRFGSQGDQEDQFRSPDAIAVDGLGRVLVADTRRILVYDNDGRYLDSFHLDEGAASGMAFDDQGYLYIVARTFVYKFKLTTQ